jgi:hypothetical protein
MFRAAVLALIASAASAATSFTPTGDILASSDLGSRLLSQATVVKDARHLEQNQDITFIATYSLRYLGCSSLVQVRQNGQGGNNNNNKNGNGGLLYNQHLVKFALCPSGCTSCSNGGEYIVNMETFVDLYTEYKLKDQEWQCEMIRENCYCDNANDDDVCLNTCYTNAGMTECIDYEGGEEFEVQRYMQCAGKNSYCLFRISADNLLSLQELMETTRTIIITTTTTATTKMDTTTRITTSDHTVAPRMESRSIWESSQTLVAPPKPTMPFMPPSTT